MEKMLGDTDETVTAYNEFWQWFKENEKNFFISIKKQKNIEKDFFDKLTQKLNEIKEGFFYLAGMYDDNTVELIITADGIIKNIVFVEDLVSVAPVIEGWKFTALKSPLNIEDVNVKMSGLKFNSSNINFYSNDYPDYPDEIDITVVYDDLDPDNKNTVTSGIYIFLDNYLGELNFATTIDNIDVSDKEHAKNELIPIEKLKDFLIWRQKEFREKYDGTRYNTDDDNYSMYEAILENGNALIAVINSDLLTWDSKASHPWILSVEIEYDGFENNGMPDKNTYELLEEIEAEISSELKDYDGYLYIGRQTAESLREIYFACKDFRKPSKILSKIKNQYSDLIEIEYDIYKDKYWQSFNRFTN